MDLNKINNKNYVESYFEENKDNILVKASEILEKKQLGRVSIVSVAEKMIFLV